MMTELPVHITTPAYRGAAALSLVLNCAKICETMAVERGKKVVLKRQPLST